MRDETPSRTAAFVAAARHLGHLLPKKARLVEDPYGAVEAGEGEAGGVAAPDDGRPPLAVGLPQIIAEVPA